MQNKYTITFIKRGEKMTVKKLEIDAEQIEEEKKAVEKAKTQEVNGGKKTEQEYESVLDLAIALPAHICKNCKTKNFYNSKIKQPYICKNCGKEIITKTRKSSKKGIMEI